MRSVQTDVRFPLSSIKPLEQLARYRQFCLARTEHAFKEGSRFRNLSPVSGKILQLAGQVDRFPYGRCSESGSLFLMRLPGASAWARLLSEVSQHRHSPEAFHLGLAQSRTDHVYAPKLEWIQEALSLQGITRPQVWEVVTPPSPLTLLLRECGIFSAVKTIDEMEFTHGPHREGTVPVALLLESLDRIDDPEELLRRIYCGLEPGGLLFLTSLVASGFDLEVLGLQNLYLYPPDRANCFSLQGLQALLERTGFTLLEVSTPGVLDVEIVQAHRKEDPLLALSSFEQRIVQGDEETRRAFQDFLQERGLSSFARLVARRSE